MSSDAVNKAKQEQLIVAVLLVVFVALFLNSLRSMGVLGGKRPIAAKGAVTSKNQPAVQGAGRALSAPSGPPAARVTPPLPSGDVTYTAQALRDPLQDLLPKKPGPVAVAETSVQATQPVKSPGVPPQLVVQGLWWQGAHAKAMIRGTLYTVGDVVDGVTITRIEREGVSGEFEGTPVHFSVSMRESSSKSFAQPGQWR